MQPLCTCSFKSGDDTSLIRPRNSSSSWIPSACLLIHNIENSSQRTNSRGTTFIRTCLYALSLITKNVLRLNFAFSSSQVYSALVPASLHHPLALYAFSNAYFSCSTLFHHIKLCLFVKFISPVSRLTMRNNTFCRLLLYKRGVAHRPSCLSYKQSSRTFSSATLWLFSSFY